MEDSEKNEEPEDDYLLVDMQELVWRFINKAMKSIPWPKEIPERIPEGLTFLQ